MQLMVDAELKQLNATLLMEIVLRLSDCVNSVLFAHRTGWFRPPKGGTRSGVGRELRPLTMEPVGWN